MTTSPMKSQPLHNFSLSFLKWGTHHPNRAPLTEHVITNSSDDDNDSTNHHRVVGSRSSRAQSLSFPRSTPIPQYDAVVGQRRLRHPAAETEKAEAEEGEAVGKPWNLRPRKARQQLGEALVDVAVFENRGDNNNNHSANVKVPKSTRLREMVESRGNGGGGDKKGKNKFWVTLSREEIEEDVFIMTGSRPARRPRKRPKNVQKQLDNVFPGLWLVGLTVDAYRETEAPVKMGCGYCEYRVLKAYIESWEDCNFRTKT